MMTVFIERTRCAASKKIVAGHFKDNPRRLGKSRVRLIAPAPLKPDRKVGGEAEFTGSSGTFARVSNAKDGTGRRGAIRNRSGSSQVVQAGFELERITVAKGQ